MNIKEIKMKKMFLFMSLYVVYNYNVISALTERKIGSPIVLLTGLFLLIIMGFLNKQFNFTWDRLKKPIIFISIFIVYLILNLFLKGKFDGGSIVKFGEFFMICVVGILIFSSSMNKDDLKDIIKVFFILNTLIFIAFVLIYHNHWIYRMSIGWRLSTKGLNATWLGRFFAETAVLCILTVDNKIVKYMYSMILFL